MPTALETVQAQAEREERIAEIEAGLKRLHPDPVACFEIRALNVPHGRGHPFTSSGYFVDKHRAAEAERHAAVDLAYTIEEQLRGFGFGLPPTMDSGNGMYLLYPVDLPNDDHTAAALRRFLAALATPHFSGTPEPGRPHATIDGTVFNAGRIMRVPGSTNRKGYHAADRPHRRAALSEAPGEMTLVSLEQIEAIAARAPAEPGRPPGGAEKTNGRHAGRRLDIPAYLRSRGVSFREKRLPGGVAYLVPCPFNEGHGRQGEAAVFQNDHGMATFECKHDGCRGKTWHDYKAAIGPPDADHFSRSAGTGTNPPVAPGTIVFAKDQANYGDLAPRCPAGRAGPSQAASSRASFWK